MALYQVTGTVSTSHNIIVTDPILEISSDIIDKTIYYRFSFYIDDLAPNVYDSFDVGTFSHNGSFNSASYSVVSGDIGKSYIDIFQDTTLSLVSDTLILNGVIATSSNITSI